MPKISVTKFHSAGSHNNYEFTASAVTQDREEFSGKSKVLAGRSLRYEPLWPQGAQLERGGTTACGNGGQERNTQKARDLKAQLKYCAMWGKKSLPTLMMLL